eukprot:11158563-Lingulodinium_polyedra.AAC.1
MCNEATGLPARCPRSPMAQSAKGRIAPKPRTRPMSFPVRMTVQVSPGLQVYAGAVLPRTH